VLFLNPESRRTHLRKSETITKKGNIVTAETDDVKAVEQLGEARDTIVTELRKVIVGMDDVIDEMTIAIFSRGHCLLVGVPGLAKTLLVSSLAQTMSLSFKRIQFTPDLMPSDITGTELLQEDPETHERKFKSILNFQHVVRRIPVADHIFEYAAALVRATRPDEADAPEFVKKLMAWGAGPRASLNLIIAGKARAALRGRSHVSIEDIQALSLPILRHRIIPNFAARSEGMTADTLIEKLLAEIPADEKLYQKKAS